MKPTRLDLREIVESIRLGVEAELRVAAKGIPFKVLGLDSSQGVVTLVLESNSGQLDDSMEDGTLRWVGMVDGTADIVSVVPEFSQLHVILTSGALPRTDQTVWINPPRFLEPLLKLWNNDDRAYRAAYFRFSFSDSRFDESLVPPTVGSAVFCGDLRGPEKRSRSVA